MGKVKSNNTCYFSAFGVVQTWLLQIILKDNIVVLSVVLALGLLAWPFVIILGASVNVRRLHDIGHSGWILLLALVPFLNIIIYIYLAVKPGILLTNKYGELATQNKLLKLLIND